jgi:lipopolysaccharide core heptose(I) kinase
MPTDLLVVAPDFRTLLDRNRLASFDEIMTVPGEETVRAFPGRNTVRLSLAREDGGVQIAYLKRYSRDYLSTWKLLLRWIGWPGARDEAMGEWQSIAELRKRDFGTAVPIALGQRRVCGVTIESFLMTAQIDGGVQADLHCRDSTPSARRALAREIADLSRRFHATGFVHKDFYLGHVFLVANDGAHRLSLIDLQRARRPRRFHRRWLVKDLGALAYSALKVGASRRDLMSFFKRYRGVKRLDPQDKALAREVLGRVKRLSRHRPKHDASFEQLGDW